MSRRALARCPEEIGVIAWHSGTAQREKYRHMVKNRGKKTHYYYYYF